MRIADYVARGFGTFPEMVGLQAQATPDKVALICGDDRISFRELERLIDRIAASLQRDGIEPQDRVAICASTSIDYAAAFIGTLRAGATICPLPPAATPDQLRAMMLDCGAKHLFLDAAVSDHLEPVESTICLRRIALTGAESESFRSWLAPDGAGPQPVRIDPDQAFNIIYSSGTTGTPKGIVQSHRMRWAHHVPADPPGYGPDAVAIISTPLYSNTTLVSFIPALAGGGTVVLMPEFEPRQFLALCERHKVSFAMLVPVQYRRILEVSDFDAFDLSSFRLKYATSAPFPAELKAEVLRRWPGGLVEYYGMTEGGGSCGLHAHERPDKLATVGQPLEGHDMRVIDEQGQELPPGSVGEIVGRSPMMMVGYHNQPGKTAEAEWHSQDGERFIRTGDIGSFDVEGFLTLLSRKKDMIISGGANIYPIDLEAVLTQHPAVSEVAVVGVPSDQWGETPAAFVVPERGQQVGAEELRDWANRQLGKIQRISALRFTASLPRNSIGKIVKAELQKQFAQGPAE